MSKIKFTNLNKINRKFLPEIKKKLNNHFKNSDFINGKEVKKFEKNFRKINKSKYCISCANGSDALVIALKSLNLKNNDEVITTSLSWIATSAAVSAAGGKVIFSDINKDDFNIDPNQIIKKITKKTVGLIIVHLYGFPVDIQSIKKIAKKYNLWIVEDCAQSHLAKYKNKIVGNFGDFGTFSFFPGKNLGAFGDAGCLVTNNKKLAKKARLYANHGGKNLHLLEGMNSRMDTIQSSILNIKLKNLNLQNQKRIVNAKTYISNLHNLENLNLPLIKKFSQPVFHQFVIKTKLRNFLKKYLSKKGIETQIHYPQILPMMKAYKKYNLSKKDFPNAYKASKEILSLPISQDHNIKIIKKISLEIIKFYKIYEKNKHSWMWKNI